MHATLKYTQANLLWNVTTTGMIGRHSSFISIDQYRATIGLFNKKGICAPCSQCCNQNYVFLSNWLLFTNLVLLSIFFSVLLILSGDIHTNPGPTSNKDKNRKSKQLSLCHVNVRSLCLRHTSVETKLSPFYDVITLSETLLTPFTNNDTLKLEGYRDIIRHDRLHRGGGGLAVYVKTFISVDRRDDLNIDSIELLWLELRFDNTKCLIGVCYRPPDSLVSFWDDLQTALDQAKLSGIQNIILTGDLNADPDTFNGNKLKYFADVNNLYIHIDEPTRITPTTETCLDQIITSCPNIVNSVHVKPPISTNDHCTVGAMFNFIIKYDAAFERHVWKYDNGDYQGMRNLVATTNWDDCLDVDSVDEACQRWIDKVLNIARQFIPNCMATIRPKDKPFYNNVLRKQTRQVMRAFYRAKDSKDPDHWERYKTLNTQYCHDIEEAKSNHFKAINNSLHNPQNLGPRKWWQIVKNVLGFGPDSDIPCIKGNNGEIISDNLGKAEAFNDFFLSHSNIDDSNANLPDEAPTCDSNIDSIFVTTKEVEDLLSSLDTSKSTGPDGIHPRILKETSSAIAPSLTRLFNMSLTRGVFPRQWKQANVAPVHKKDSKSQTSNYRPISLLSIAGKVLEKIVFKHVFNYFRDNFLLSIFQSGFTPGDSTVNQLVNLYHILCEALDKKKEVRIVFCDISKAFDRVWHRGLIYKLQRMGIRGVLLKWFINYLEDRYQRVVIKGQKSSLGKINAGVPQGSVLGPLLFLVYINDITNIVNNQIRLFADDTTLFITVDDPHEAAQSMNADLDKINEWANKWLVNFNAQKTKSMLVSRKLETVNPPLFFNNVQIDEVENHKHLGIILNNKLSWYQHTDNIVTRARKKLDILHRMRYKLDRKSLETLYFAYVRPPLEYGDEVWSDCDDYCIENIEKVEIDAARIVSGAILRTPKRILYDELKWTPITERYKNHKLILFKKMMSDKAPSYLCNMVPNRVRDNHRYPLRNGEDLVNVFGRTAKMYNSFLPYSIREWNKLPDNIKQYESLSSFKYALNKNVPSCNKLFYYGERYCNVIHARLRMECSALNAHLFYMFIIESPRCMCGYALESTEHFFLHCPLYIRHRRKLLNDIQNVTNLNISVNLLLHGSTDISYMNNIVIFESVHNFIKESARF